MHLGIVFAPDKSVQSDLQDGTLVHLAPATL